MGGGADGLFDFFFFFKPFLLKTTSTKGSSLRVYWSLYLKPCYGSVLAGVIVLRVIEGDTK